jgi:signal peptidase I
MLVALVLLSGFVALVDRLVFRQRRVRMMGSAAVQQVLSSIKPEDRRQALIDWAETDFTAAEYAKSFFPVLLVVLILRSFLLEPFKIPSASMVPTLQVHDFILVNKFAYGLRLPVVGTKILPIGNPARGDVMVFYPPNDKRYFIKRVIGLPGDQIQLRDNVLYINGVGMDQKVLGVDRSVVPAQIVTQENLQPLEHLMQHSTVRTGQSNFEAVVPEGAYFMMGDNRDNSSDSRFWGMVPENNVVGKAVYVWMHWGAVLSLPSFSRNGVIQ